jgi:hypothetical protein
MGMDDKAAEQTALFTNKKFDPGAPTYSLDFLLKHPEINTESVPWHVHSDLPPEQPEQRKLTGEAPHKTTTGGGSK